MKQSPKPVTRTVEKILRQLADMRMAKSTHIAEALGLKPAKMGLALKLEGTLFSDIVTSEKKHRFFVAFIADRHIDGESMAEITGMADYIGFCAAFERWTGLKYSEAKKLPAEKVKTLLWFSD